VSSDPADTPQAPGSAPPRRRTRRIVLAAAVAALLGLAAAGALAHRGSHTPNVPLPLRTVAQMTLPAPSTRFDYADIDPATHRLFLAQLGASRLLEIDTASRRVVRITAGLASVHGVIVVPSLHRVFATATGTNQLVALDETSGAVLYRTATGDYPDGLTYVSSTGQLWISNESGGTETVIDAATGHVAGTVELGGEAGNVRYDPAHDQVLADVQTRNQIAGIDPHTRTTRARAAVPGCDHDHGLILDPASTRAFVACDGNAQLVVLSLPHLRTTGQFPVGGDPDLLAIDPLHHILYVTAESGVLTTLDIHTTPGRVTGRARLGDNAHVVAVDPTTGQAYFPVLNKHGQPTLFITDPNP
jgi:DNA-binding beta-propeller fold protein YncE